MDLLYLLTRHVGKFKHKNIPRTSISMGQKYSKIIFQAVIPQKITNSEN